MWRGSVVGNLNKSKHPRSCSFPLSYPYHINIAYLVIAATLIIIIKVEEEDDGLLSSFKVASLTMDEDEVVTTASLTGNNKESSSGGGGIQKLWDQIIPDSYRLDFKTNKKQCGSEIVK